MSKTETTPPTLQDCRKWLSEEYAAEHMPEQKKMISAAYDYLKKYEEFLCQKNQ